MTRSSTYLSLISLAIFYSCSSGSGEKEGYHINGVLEGVEEGYAYLQQPSANGLKTVDSTRISSGRYEFEGTIDLPEVYYIKINNSNYYITFFLENSLISIESHIDSLYKSRVTGSVCQKELDEFHDQVTPYKEKLRALYKAYYQAEKDNDEQKMTEIDSEYEKIHFQQIRFMKDYALNNPSSVVASYITARYLSNELDYTSLDSLYTSFKTNLDNDRYLKKLNKRLEVLEKVAIGRHAVDIIQNDTAHNQISLSSFKGKNVLIEFWASWCTTCRTENKRLKKIYADFRGPDFEIFAVSLDNDLTQWTDAIKESQLPWINVSDLKGWQSDTRKMYGVIKTPHNVLINKEGFIVAKDIYGDELVEKLEALHKSL